MVLGLLIHYFHIHHNAPCLPSRIFHNHCFQFLQGINVVPGEIENNGYAKFWGVTRCIMVYVKVVCKEKRYSLPTFLVQSSSRMQYSTNSLAESISMVTSFTL